MSKVTLYFCMVHDMTFMHGCVTIYKQQRVIQLNLFIFQKFPIKWLPIQLFVQMTHVKTFCKSIPSITIYLYLINLFIGNINKSNV